MLPVQGMFHHFVEALLEFSLVIMLDVYLFAPSRIRKRGLPLEAISQSVALHVLVEISIEHLNV